MKKLKFLAAASAVSCLLVFNACQKDQQQSAALTDEEAFMAQDNALLDNESNQIQNVVDVFAYSTDQIGVRSPGFGNRLLDSMLPSCATVSFDTTAQPRYLIINFGNSPCLCSNWDGKYRQGQVKITWTGKLKEAGTVLTVTTSNYFRGVAPDSMNQLTYSKTVTNNGMNSGGLLTYSIEISATLNTFDGKTATWQANRQKVFVHGENTPELADDVFSITGTESGINRFGTTFQANITTPLTVDRTCRWPVSGVIDIMRTGKPDETFDYGNGTCDDLATITINGHSRTIMLP